MGKKYSKSRKDNNWDKKPEWLRTVNKVAICKEKGMSMEDTAVVLKEDFHAVKRIYEDEKLAENMATQYYNEKIPVIENIVGFGLVALERSLKDLVTNESLRKEVLKTPKDVSLLVTAIKDLNTLLRLELGKSTLNIASSTIHTYQQTREAVQELSKMDGVFDWPELPAPPAAEGEIIENDL